MLMTELNPFINNLAVGVGIYSLYKLDNNDFVAGLQRSVKAGVIRIVELGKNQWNSLNMIFEEHKNPVPQNFSFPIEVKQYLLPHIFGYCY